jgi:glycosyltransferase involved in cell wall biosynthesis
MTNKVKILWIGDGGVASGFARVNHSIINYLPDNYEIHHLAVNHHGDPYPTRKNHLLYPALTPGGDVLGISRIQPLCHKIQPDLIFILNDPWVINDYLTRIPKEFRVVAYTPVDAMYLHDKWVHNLQLINKLVTYTEFGKSEMLRQAPDFNDIEVIPHGTDLHKFYPIDRDEARKALNLPLDDFYVFNGNRNQPRKRIDLTIKAFAKFAEDKPENVKLYLHMGMRDAGHHIGELAKRYGVESRVVMTDKSLSPSNYVSEADLNRIYNAMNVGINTSMGEGWGLVNVEHACCKVPQIVPNFSATAEIFAPDEALHIDYLALEPHMNILTEGCIIDTDHAAYLLNKVYYNREFADSVAEKGYEKFTRPEYTWESVAGRFIDVFERVLQEEPKALKNNTEETK